MFILALLLAFSLLVLVAVCVCVGSLLGNLLNWVDKKREERIE